jgi:hypothetical protein
LTARHTSVHSPRADASPRTRLRSTALAPIIGRPSALAIRVRLPRFESCFRGRDRGQARLASLQFGGEIVAGPRWPVRRILRGIGGLGGGEKRRDLLTQPALLLQHPRVAPRFAFARIRVHLGAVDRHGPQLHDARCFPTSWRSECASSTATAVFLALVALPPRCRRPDVRRGSIRP